MIDFDRYTSGAIALANLSASIRGLESRRAKGATFEELSQLSNLVFVRGDLLGRITDHEHAEAVAIEAITLAPASAAALHLHARLAGRFHRFHEAEALLAQALAAGHPRDEIDAERAAILQATGRYREALAVRERLAREDPTIHTLGTLASLLAQAGRWAAAEGHYAVALDVDDGPSPIPCAQLLFEWGVGAMRRRDLDRADEIFLELHALLPGHVPGLGHRAEVALARGDLDRALALVEPLLEISDDPEYRATYAQILAARGDPRSTAHAGRAVAAFEALLARRPEAYAHHAEEFFPGIHSASHRHHHAPRP